MMWSDAEKRWRYLGLIIIIQQVIPSAQKGKKERV